MEFARKQLEKFGWKEGDGLGKDRQGISVALKPTLKTGTEGMGYDLCTDLTDTWWTKAYSDSLSRIHVNVSDDKVDVEMKEEDRYQQEGRGREKKKRKKNKDLYAEVAVEERPMEKMRKRMVKANFTTFSKGGTLTNGEMVEGVSSLKRKEEKSVVKVLTDDELLKACGGRTAHKAARFGLKLNGKLARIAAQEEIDRMVYGAVSTSTTTHSKEHKKKKRLKVDQVLQNSIEQEIISFEIMSPKKEKKTKSKSNETAVDNKISNYSDEVQSKKKKKSKAKNTRSLDNDEFCER